MRRAGLRPNPGLTEVEGSKGGLFARFDFGLSARSLGDLPPLSAEIRSGPVGPYNPQRSVFEGSQVRRDERNLLNPSPGRALDSDPRIMVTERMEQARLRRPGAQLPARPVHLPCRP